MSNFVPKKIRYAGAVYVLADVVVDHYASLDENTRKLVDTVLQQSKYKPGTPEYEQLKQRLSQQYAPHAEMTQQQMARQTMYTPTTAEVDLKDPDIGDVVRSVLGAAGITVEQICALGDSLRHLCEAESTEDEGEDE